MSAPLASAAKWVIILGIAYTVATTALFFVSDSDELGENVDAPRAQQAAPRPVIDTKAIVDRHLFGIADAEPVEDEPQQAVVTRLPLELKAVFLATDEDTDEDLSTAIIAQRGKAGLLYRIGEKVPGNAELVAVAVDHVILSRAGSRERLNFPQLKSKFTTASSASATPAREAPRRMQPNRGGVRTAPQPVPTAPPVEEQTAREVVESYQEELENDPDALLDRLGVETADEGGYRIGSLAQSPTLSQTGLQPGDVIVSVNGQPVGDVDADRAFLTQVLEQGTARIEVKRGSRRFFVTTSLQ